MSPLSFPREPFRRAPLASLAFVLLFTMFFAKRVRAQTTGAPSPSSTVVSPLQPTPAPALAPAAVEPAAAGTPAAPAPPPAPAPATPEPAAPPAPAGEPVPAAAPPAAAPPAAAPPPVTDARLGYSIVHLGSSYPGTWLELENRVDRNGWQRACLAPCDAPVYVDGTLARVSAPGMTTSNPFRIDPGPGTALVRIDGGSARARSLGVLGFVIGIPTSLAGGALYGYGSYADREGFRIGGVTVLGLGALAVVAAIPLLLAGSTTVRDGHGSAIARATPGAPLGF